MNMNRLVTLPIEQYLRQNEAKIRTAGGEANSDPFVRLHLDAVLMAEDLADSNETLAQLLETRNKPGDQGRAVGYYALRDQANQLRYHHLQMIANHVL
jgi:hypothetical protein